MTDTKKINDLTLATPDDSMQREYDIGGAIQGKTILSAEKVYFNTNIAQTGTFTVATSTPSQITANQNDYVLGANSVQRLSSDASRDLTGIAAATLDGTIVLIINVGSNNIVLKHQSTSSAAANRIISPTAADVTLAANKQAQLLYDLTTGRWRIISYT